MFAVSAIFYCLLARFSRLIAAFSSFVFCLNPVIAYWLQYLVTNVLLRPFQCFKGLKGPFFLTPRATADKSWAAEIVLINTSGALLGIASCSFYHDRIVEWINSKFRSSEEPPEIKLDMKGGAQFQDHSGTQGLKGPA